MWEGVFLCSSAIEREENFSTKRPSLKRIKLALLCATVAFIPNWDCKFLFSKIVHACTQPCKKKNPPWIFLLLLRKPPQSFCSFLLSFLEVSLASYIWEGGFFLVFWTMYIYTYVRLRTVIEKKAFKYLERVINRLSSPAAPPQLGSSLLN